MPSSDTQRELELPPEAPSGTKKRSHTARQSEGLTAPPLPKKAKVARHGNLVIPLHDSHLFRRCLKSGHFIAIMPNQDWWMRTVVAEGNAHKIVLGPGLRPPRRLWQQRRNVELSSNWGVQQFRMDEEDWNLAPNWDVESVMRDPSSDDGFPWLVATVRVPFGRVRYAEAEGKVEEQEPGAVDDDTNAVSPKSQPVTMNKRAEMTAEGVRTAVVWEGGQGQRSGA